MRVISPLFLVRAGFLLSLRMKYQVWSFKILSLCSLILYRDPELGGSPIPEVPPLLVTEVCNSGLVTVRRDLKQIFELDFEAAMLTGD